MGNSEVFIMKKSELEVPGGDTNFLVQDGIILRDHATSDDMDEQTRLRQRDDIYNDHLNYNYMSPIRNDIVSPDVMSSVMASSLEGKMIYADTLPILEDHAVKSKMNSIASKYKGFYSDDAWQPINKLQRELEGVLDNLALTSSEYGRGFPPENKIWIMVGAFKTSKSVNRAVWVQIIAGGSGTVKDPLSKYDIICQIEILSPKNLSGKEGEYVKSLL